MGISYNPCIITSGLELALDAANPKSYPGSGTTWSDLSTNAYPCTLVNGVSYSTNNKGYMLFNGTDNSANIPSSVYNFGTSDFTISTWVLTTVSSTNQRIFDQSLSGQINNLFSILTAGFLNFRIIDAISGTDFTVQSNTVLLANTWYNCLIKRNGSTWSLYINGVLENTGVSSAAYPWRSEVLFNIGYSAITNNAFFSGYMSNILIYKNIGLSDSQIKQNFNAIRGRYGI